MKTPAGVSAYVMNDLFTCCLSKANTVVYTKFIKPAQQGSLWSLLGYNRTSVRRLLRSSHGITGPIFIVSHKNGGENPKTQSHTYLWIYWFRTCRRLGRKTSIIIHVIWLTTQILLNCADLKCYVQWRLPTWAKPHG